MEGSGGLILAHKLAVHELIHKRRLADTAVAQDNDLEEHLSSCRCHDIVLQRIEIEMEIVVVVQ